MTDFITAAKTTLTAFPWMEKEDVIKATLLEAVARHDAELQRTRAQNEANAANTLAKVIKVNAQTRLPGLD